jgi:Asp-tRNA(Asn)/Glu-tRNA(Gln) amidotransferase A subunit family amidase
VCKTNSSRYTRQAEKIFLPNDGGISVLLVPTARTHYTIAQIRADPVAKNSALGDFAHFANIVDLCAIALPVGTYPAPLLSGQKVEPGTTEAKQAMLPFGVTLLGPRFADGEVLDLGERIMGAVNKSLRGRKELAA